ncbi:MAG TPA: DNA translocase FtsK 4TM domain-containing protein [Myxococcales bacterium]|nr:DNA translocase FtsK 4TM domain-containing protein [Myxococcales bacterium]
MGRKGKSGGAQSKAREQVGWKKPVAGILLGGFAMLLLLGLSSYEPRSASANWAGPVGQGLASSLLEVAGAGGYAIALFLVVVACALLFGRPKLSFARAASWLLFSLCTMALVDLLVRFRLQGHAPGGAIGAVTAGAAKSALSVPGAAVLLFAVACAALTVATDLWALHAAKGAAKLGVAGGALAFRGAAAAISRAREAAAAGADETEAELLCAEEDARIVTPKKPKVKPEALALAALEEPPQDPREPVPAVLPIANKPKKTKRAEAAPTPAVPDTDPNPAAPVPFDLDDGDAKKPATPEAAKPSAAAPQIVEQRALPKPVPATALPKPVPVPVEFKGDSFKLAKGISAFTPPPITILTGEASQHLPLDRDGLTATAEKLRQKLASFGIQGQVTQIRPGPVVTMFEFLPAAGVKVSRIASLSDDLAMAMEAMRVRIVAPIPGKGVVGIEVPNKTRETVVLRELVEQDAFQKSQSKLAMCLGKDIEGLPYVADLAKMPHLLIAGTTGSGKSVAVNSMIVSILLRATPEEVRFLMVDPKMLELSVYEGIPHLLLPVVTDSKKAAMALRWGVEEMERRYQLLADCGVRNIASYNKKVEKEGNGARIPSKQPKEKRVVDLSSPSLDAHELAQGAMNGELERAEPDNPAVALLRENERKIASGEQLTLPAEPEPEQLRKLPYLVIIIDELADLMMVASREVETYIARLAQMARAAGIHLMVATQRPSTDVVTGVIKANFPARISFQVASRHDSATIINTPGAENLLGMGDMLILPPGTSTLTRVHGPYVDEKEIHAVVEHWKAQGAPVYDPNILKPRAEDGEGLPQDDEGPDELYDQALASLADMRFISISLLQRKLRVGYNRAARMIERMERDGIVGAADGAKPREVLIRALGEMPGAGA